MIQGVQVFGASPKVRPRPHIEDQLAKCLYLTLIPSLAETIPKLSVSTIIGSEFPKIIVECPPASAKKSTS
jgi:hypothetical protein